MLGKKPTIRIEATFNTTEEIQFSQQCIVETDLLHKLLQGDVRLKIIRSDEALVAQFCWRESCFPLLFFEPTEQAPQQIRTSRNLLVPTWENNLWYWQIFHESARAFALQEIGRHVDILRLLDIGAACRLQHELIRIAPDMFMADIF